MSLTTAGGIRVTGAWTRAGLGSCVRVEGANKFDDILFDCGVCEPECLKAGFVFISHGHVDHIGACVMHARAKALTSKPSVYYVPTESVGPLEEARVAFSKMDGKDIPMNIVPLGPGDEVRVNSDLRVKVFPTVHRVPSQGYALYKITTGSLLAQYSGLPGKDIGELRKSGVKVVGDDVESLELVYTGDTVMEGLTLPCNSFIFTAHILIMEMTYLDGDRQKAVDRGHIHLQDVAEHADRFQNQQIVFVHISERYGPHSKALMMLRDGLPPELLQRSVVSLRSFGSGEHLTKIAAVDWNKRRAEVGWGWGRQVNTSTHRGGSSRGNSSFQAQRTNSAVSFNSQDNGGDTSFSVQYRSSSHVATSSATHAASSSSSSGSSSSSHRNADADITEADAVSRLRITENHPVMREGGSFSLDGGRDHRARGGRSAGRGRGQRGPHRGGRSRGYP